MDILSRCSSISHEFIIKNVPSQNKLDQAEDFDTSYDKNSLIFYDRLKIISSIALFIGHIIFCTGLFYPIIILKGMWPLIETIIFNDFSLKFFILIIYLT